MSPTKQFPWRCAECGKREVHPCTVRGYVVQVKHDGRAYEVCIPEFSVPKCQACEALHIDIQADQQIQEALRAKIGLLSPEQIRKWRVQLGLTQRQFAAALGFAHETVSRWESGALIQSRANDKLMRLFFEMPDVREMLTHPDEHLSDSMLVEGLQQFYKKKWTEADFSGSFGFTLELPTGEGKPFICELVSQEVHPSGKVAA